MNKYNLISLNKQKNKTLDFCVYLCLYIRTHTDTHLEKGLDIYASRQTFFL